MILQSVVYGKFVRREKRFFAYIQIDSGEVLVAHCPNTGSMKGLLVPGADVILTHHPDRKGLKYTWEFVQVQGAWVGVNTQNPNRLLSEYVQKIAPGELWGLKKVLGKEVAISPESKCDLLADGDLGEWYLEAKNVTLNIDQSLGLFPDSVSERAQKHLRELVALTKSGKQAGLVFVVQHQATEIVKPCDIIDPDYGRLLRWAVLEKGLPVQCLRFHIQPEPNRVEFWLHELIPLDLS